jgi:antitoxin VapB
MQAKGAWPMSSARTTLFRNNTSQAVRLPKALELPESVKQVSIIAVGNTRIIAPVAESWAAWFDGPPMSADFMEERSQPVDQLREVI